MLEGSNLTIQLVTCMYNYKFLKKKLKALKFVYNSSKHNIRLNISLGNWTS